MDMEEARKRIRAIVKDEIARWIREAPSGSIGSDFGWSTKGTRRSRKKENQDGPEMELGRVRAGEERDPEYDIPAGSYAFTTTSTGPDDDYVNYEDFQIVLGMERQKGKGHEIGDESVKFPVYKWFVQVFSGDADETGVFIGEDVSKKMSGIDLIPYSPSYMGAPKFCARTRSRYFIYGGKRRRNVSKDGIADAAAGSIISMLTYEQVSLLFWRFCRYRVPEKELKQLEELWKPYKKLVRARFPEDAEDVEEEEEVEAEEGKSYTDGAYRALKKNLYLAIGEEGIALVDMFREFFQRNAGRDDRDEIYRKAFERVSAALSGISGRSLTEAAGGPANEPGVEMERGEILDEFRELGRFLGYYQIGHEGSRIVDLLGQFFAGTFSDNDRDEVYRKVSQDLSRILSER